jgi:hypothetical protein
MAGWKIMAVSDHYKELLAAAQANLDALSGDVDSLAALTRAHNHAAALDVLQTAISNRPEGDLLRLAIREYQYAVMAASYGNYRHAYMSLRLTLELAFGALYFSAHEIKYWKWVDSSNDIKWSVLSDENSGIFSHDFFDAFFREARGLVQQYRALAITLYRELSEYVHGNPHTHAEADQGGFDADKFKAWADRADTAKMIITFMFAIRFLKRLDVEKLTDIQETILTELGHVEPLRSVYEA